MVVYFFQGTSLVILQALGCRQGFRVQDSGREGGAVRARVPGKRSGLTSGSRWLGCKDRAQDSGFGASGPETFGFLQGRPG